MNTPIACLLVVLAAWLSPAEAKKGKHPSAELLADMLEKYDMEQLPTKYQNESVQLQVGITVVSMLFVGFEFSFNQSINRW